MWCTPLDKISPWALVLAVNWVLTLALSPVLAEDWAAIWSNRSDTYGPAFMNGLADGLSWARTLSKFAEKIPEAERDARQRLMYKVFSDSDKLNGSAVARVISSFYQDPANAQ